MVVSALPGWRVHTFIDKFYLGKAYPKIHRRIDRPYKYFGRGHRILFHDHASAYCIARDSYPDDPNAVWSAYHHIRIDDLCSKDPEYKKLLEKLEAHSPKKKRKKLTPKRKTPKDSTITYLKKLVECKRLSEVFYSRTNFL